MMHNGFLRFGRGTFGVGGPTATTEPASTKQSDRQLLSTPKLFSPKASSRKDKTQSTSIKKNQDAINKFSNSLFLLEPQRVQQQHDSDLFFRDHLSRSTLIARPSINHRNATPKPRSTSTSTTTHTTNTDRSASTGNPKSTSKNLPGIRLPPFAPLGRKVKKDAMDTHYHQNTLNDISSSSSISASVTKSKAPLTSPSSSTSLTSMPTTLSRHSIQSKSVSDISTTQRSSARQVKDVIARVSRVCQAQLELQKETCLKFTSEATTVSCSGSSSSTLNGCPIEDDTTTATAVSTASPAGVAAADTATSQLAFPPSILQELATLANWAKDPYYVVVMTKNHGIPVTVQAMDAYPQNPEFLVHCCDLLTRLLIPGGSGTTASVLSETKEPQPQHLVQTITPTLTTAVAVAAEQAGVIPQLLSVMERHPQESALQWSACQTLERLVPLIQASSTTTVTTTSYMDRILQAVERTLLNPEDGVIRRNSTSGGISSTSTSTCTTSQRIVVEKLLTQLKAIRGE
jgi:hypothetical protein